MSAMKTKLLIGLGVIVALIPFLSIYRSWKDGISLVAGILIIAAAGLLRFEERRRSRGAAPAVREADSFMQNDLAAH